MIRETKKVEVTEVTIDPVLNRILGPDGVPIRVDLGDSRVNQNVNRLLHVISKRPNKTFLLRWSDGRVPQGAVVGGHTIGWTQHGVVNDREGHMVGTYDRLTDTRDEQLMMVRIFTD